MGMMKEWTRRKFMKNIAMGAGAAAAGTALPGRMGWGMESVPPGKKLFNDIGLL